MDLIRAHYEIPKGSKLYYNGSANLKREFENHACKVLLGREFKEILTPYLSYHQYLSVDFEDSINFTDAQNHSLSLRADSTVDVVRIVRRRLKDESAKRVFYIQPVFKYPSKETHQIGAELIGENELELCISAVSEIFDEFDLSPNVQISNIEIPHIICEIFGIDMDVFKDGFQVEVLRKRKIKWLDELLRLTKLQDLQSVLDIVPDKIKKPLSDMGELASVLKDSAKVYLAPLYYSKMRYYDKLFFRFFERNRIYCSGGAYELDGLSSSGFGIVTDNVIEKILESRD
ncbi:MAG: ATP phosphoribosyltransferase regulatory subunit [Campylobacter sp.]|nr:ATP phosphoribosyltransferase regulatory subunit [Campylobacter sp.]